MLRACSLKDEDFKKPLIGVANTWIEIGPCNYHLRELAAQVKEGIRAAGGAPLEFNTVSINDGITMGTDGMRASLVSREVICRFDRACDAREHVRRDHHPGRVRQDDSGRDYGGGPTEYSGGRAVRRVDRAGKI